MSKNTVSEEVADSVLEGKPNKDAKKRPQRPLKSRKGSAKRRKTNYPTKPGGRKRGRREKPVPSQSFREVAVLGEAIVVHGGGNKVRRLTIFEKLNRSPSSSTSRDLVTNSAKYKITTGSYSADFLEVTDVGAKACDPNVSPRERRRAEFELAIMSIDAFRQIYEQNVDKRFPAKEVLRDQMAETGIERDDVEQCVDLFIVNCNDLELLRTIGGAETLVSIDQVVESLPGYQGGQAPSPVRKARSISDETYRDGTDLSKVCFYISPIGEEDSDPRKHSDLLLNAVVRPAVEPLGLVVVRADAIGQPGMITSQTLEYIRHAKLAIADLSMLNPNVFYEIALRHACKQPIVHMMRKADQMPFDVGQFRAVVLDMASIYTLVPRLETYKTELAQQAKSAIEDPESSTNPISVFYPAFWK